MKLDNSSSSWLDYKYEYAEIEIDDEKVSREKDEFLTEFLFKMKSPIHSPIRLGILFLLYIWNEIPFVKLQKTLKATSGNLNSHLTKLQQKGYIQIRKNFVDFKPQTTVVLTDKGARALVNHLSHLKVLINNVLQN